MLLLSIGVYQRTLGGFGELAADMSEEVETELPVNMFVQVLDAWQLLGFVLL